MAGLSGSLQDLFAPTFPFERVRKILEGKDLLPGKVALDEFYAAYHGRGEVGREQARVLLAQVLANDIVRDNEYEWDLTDPDDLTVYSHRCGSGSAVQAYYTMTGDYAVLVDPVAFFEEYLEDNK